MKWFKSKRGRLIVVFSIILFIICVTWQMNTRLIEAEQWLQEVPPNPDEDWDYWSNPPHVLSNVSGNVGIGTPTPGAKLDVNGEIKGFGVVPIGTILSWHKDMSGTPALPEGWIECNGQLIIDSESPYDGTYAPNLTDNRFLQGSITSGISHDQNLPNHIHEWGYVYPGGSLGSLISFNSDGGYEWVLKGCWAGNAGGLEHDDAVDFYGGSFWTLQPAFISGELRPKSFTIVWIMRIK